MLYIVVQLLNLLAKYKINFRSSQKNMNAKSFNFVGEHENILGTLDSLNGMNRKDKNDLMRKYETCLINACSSENIYTENLLDIIIAAETLKLDMVCPPAINLATRCKSRSLKESRNYKKISYVTRNKIDEQRIFWLEKNGTRLDVKFLNVNPDYQTSKLYTETFYAIRKKI